MPVKSRQTEDIVEMLLPGGEGRVRGALRWNNGPPTFTPDGRHSMDLYKVDLGGSSPGRWWRRVWFLPGHPPVEADIIQAGEDHYRRYSPIFGDGWVVYEAEGCWVRFETLNDETKVRFMMRSSHAGRPAYVEKSEKSRTRFPAIDDPDEMNWNTIKSSDGSVFTFRRGGSLVPGTFVKVADHDYALLTPKARKVYDAALAEHERANAKSNTD